MFESPSICWYIGFLLVRLVITNLFASVSLVPGVARVTQSVLEVVA